jgi:hypothetical protein
MNDPHANSDRGSSFSYSIRFLFAFIALFLGAYTLYWALTLKTVIGATVDVIEPQSGFVFKARVDTGASISSLHCTKIEIENASNDPVENSGHKTRFLLEGADGKEYWLEAMILGYTDVRSALGTLRRYRVRMKFTCGGITKGTLVSLNDRSDLKYPLLLGRDFLEDDFVVDVSLDNPDFP